MPLQFHSVEKVLEGIGWRVIDVPVEVEGIDLIGLVAIWSGR